MRIISFGHTTPALVAGAKTVTRRDWKGGYATLHRAGDQLAAYDRSPRFRGRQIATIALTEAPYPEDSDAAPPADYAAEGFEWLEERGYRVFGHPPAVLWQAWRQHPRDLWVVRFAVVALTEYGEELRAHIARADERRLELAREGATA